MYNAMMSAANQSQMEFLMPQMGENEFSSEELAEDTDGLQMRFMRVKVPSGGSLQFELPTDDPDRPAYAGTLVGVILYNHASNSYWAEGSEFSDNEPPLCSSVDGKKGIGEPGGLCATCALNAFGSGSKGRGKACKNMRILYLLRSGEYMPLQLSLPPTSLNPFNEFMNRAFMARQRASFGSLVEIGLKKMNNGNEYSVATFRRLRDFSGEELAQIRAYANGFRPQIKAWLEQRAAMNREQLNDLCEYDALPASPTSGDEPYCVPAEVNGDLEGLPA